MIKKIPQIILLFAAFTYAQKPYDFKKAEIESRKLIYSRPDSAVTIIKKTLGHAVKNNVHDTIIGNTYNLYGMYYGMKGNPDSSIYYFKKSLNYVDGYSRNKVRSLLNLSIAYRNKSDYTKAINLIDEVVQINTREKNRVGLAMAYGELASNYNYMLEYDKSVNYLLKAITILKEENNTAQLVAIKQKLANTYLAKENFKFAIDLYRETLKEFKELGADKNYYLTLVNLGEAQIHINDLSGAKQSLREAAAGLEAFGDKELIGITYSKVGNLERMQGHFSKAVDNYQKAVDILSRSGSSRIIRIGGEYINLLNTLEDYPKALKVIASVEAMNKLGNANIQDKMIYKNAIADTYKATNNDKEAIKAYKQTIAIMDSISASDKETAVREIQAKFQTELQREKNLALEKNNKVLQKTVETEKRLIILYILISIIVIMLILLFLRASWLKNRLQKEELKSIEAENNLIKQQQQHEQDLINNQREIIDEKQRELTSMALRMANYQDSLNEIIKKCDSNIFTQVNDVKKDLKQLIKSTDYWKQFEKRFNQLHPEFNQNLTQRFSNLTRNDIEFCSLLKLNLSNKEIASLLQISHESAITKKYRIKKKMEIQDDTEFEKLLMRL